MQYMKYLDEAKDKTKKYEETLHCLLFFIRFEILSFFSVKTRNKGRISSNFEKVEPKCPTK